MLKFVRRIVGRYPQIVEPPKQFLEITGRDKVTGNVRTLLRVDIDVEARMLWKEQFAADDERFTLDDFVRGLSERLEGALAYGEAFNFHAAPNVSLIVNGSAWSALKVQIRECR